MTMLRCQRLICYLAVRFLSQEVEELRDRIEQLRAVHRLDSAHAPSWIAQAMLISGEDHRFFQHGGIDVIAICRALWRGVVLGHREGASTIEMQLVRVMTGRFERTFTRKLREGLLAVVVSSTVTKSDIPALYLRVAYYGTGMNGYSCTCARLRLDPLLLSPRQAAGLVARLKYPEPAMESDRVNSRIRLRTAHLLRLHNEHLETRAYHGLLRSTEYATV